MQILRKIMLNISSQTQIGHIASKWALKYILFYLPDFSMSIYNIFK